MNSQELQSKAWFTYRKKLNNYMMVYHQALNQQHLVHDSVRKMQFFMIRWFSKTKCKKNRCFRLRYKRWQHFYVLLTWYQHTKNIKNSMKHVITDKNLNIVILCRMVSSKTRLIPISLLSMPFTCFLWNLINGDLGMRILW